MLLLQIYAKKIWRGSQLFLFSTSSVKNENNSLSFWFLCWDFLILTQNLVDWKPVQEREQTSNVALQECINRPNTVHHHRVGLQANVRENYFWINEFVGSKNSSINYILLCVNELIHFLFAIEIKSFLDIQHCVN